MTQFLGKPSLNNCGRQVRSKGREKKLPILLYSAKVISCKILELSVYHITMRRSTMQSAGRPNDKSYPIENKILFRKFLDSRN